MRAQRMSLRLRSRPCPVATRGLAVRFISMWNGAGRGARRGNAADELALYLAHGCDHLSGANDRTLRERRRMRRRELLWLAQARRNGLMAGLWA